VTLARSCGRVWLLRLLSVAFESPRETRSAVVPDGAAVPVIHDETGMNGKEKVYGSIP
jgi:hypothetical protein